MFLSRLECSVLSRDVQRDLSDAYQMHRTLSCAWGGASEFGAARVLFRVEGTEERPGGSPIILVQSRVGPDWSRLPPKYLQASQVKAWSPDLRPGQRLAFRLRANPTVKRAGQRWGLYEEREQLRWLARKAAQHGFELPTRLFLDREDGEEELPDVSLRPEGEIETGPGRTQETVRFRRVATRFPQRAGEGEGRLRRAVFTAICFDGVLRVRDVEAFRAALESGIGSGKAVGFGLLSVARAAST